MESQLFFFVAQLFTSGSLLFFLLCFCWEKKPGVIASATLESINIRKSPIHTSAQKNEHGLNGYFSDDP